MGSDYPGITVMLNMLAGRDRGLDVFERALGKTLAEVRLDEDAGPDGALVFRFEDGSGMALRDEGRSCCESRYMVCEDDLSYYRGAKLQNVVVKDAPDEEDEYGNRHEVQFLEVVTDKGSFTVATHNSHNGYYGGFWIRAVELPGAQGEPA